MPGWDWLGRILSPYASSLPASMSQSTTISPSPTSRKPVVLSRNDCFSMPVIHCLGFFLGTTASSLSVSILIARSSSITRPQGSAAANLAPINATEITGTIDQRTFQLLITTSVQPGCDFLASFAPFCSLPNPTEVLEQKNAKFAKRQATD